MNLSMKMCKVKDKAKGTRQQKTPDLLTCLQSELLHEKINQLHYEMLTACQHTNNMLKYMHKYH